MACNTVQQAQAALANPQLAAASLAGTTAGLGRQFHPYSSHPNLSSALLQQQAQQQQMQQQRAIAAMQQQQLQMRQLQQQAQATAVAQVSHKLSICRDPISGNVKLHVQRRHTNTNTDRQVWKDRKH